MEKIAFALTSDWIALNDLLKATGLAPSGGMAKAMIAEELVRVDGQIETRKTCKIRAGQVITLDGALIVVTGPDAAAGAPTK
jgi:ribosome-associated protein